MKSERILKSLNFLLDEQEIAHLEKKTKEFVSLLKKEVSDKKVDASVFVGGSFRKGTLTKSDKYDVDIFVRFGKKHKDLSKELESILKSFCKRLGADLKKIHGSRDYFLIENREFSFEIVPVRKIKNVKNAENVTDLSFFHVSYVVKNASDKIKKEIALAKKFCEAQGVYGAESYIGGFSGYALECLIIYYKSFEKMLKELIKAKRGEKKIIDPEKLYRKESDIFIEINESKLNSPVILIDPIHKERNALAGLGQESFLKFQDAAKKFLKSPSEKFFYKTEAGAKKLTGKGEFVKVTAETDRQSGDIAGAKMKKFFNYLEKEIAKYFQIKKSIFEYRGRGKQAEFYFLLKSKVEIMKRGPPLEKKSNVKEFKLRNKNVFVREGRVYAKVRIADDGKKFIRDFSMKNFAKFREMGIVKLNVS